MKVGLLSPVSAWSDKMVRNGGHFVQTHSEMEPFEIQTEATLRIPDLSGIPFPIVLLINVIKSVKQDVESQNHLINLPTCPLVKYLFRSYLLKQLSCSICFTY